MKIAKTGIAIIICAALIFVTYKYATKPKDSKGQMPFGMARQNAVQVTSVRTKIAQFTDLQDYVSTTGEIEGQSSIAVYPEIGGKITSVNANLGSYVKKGDLIAKIDPSSPGMEYALYSLYAPVSGTITASPLKKGTTVNMNTAITTIGDIDNLQINANIPERFTASLKTGLKADIYLQAYPDEVFKATVTRVSPVVDKASRTKEITLSLDNKDSRVNAGMFAKVKLYTDLYKQSIIVPNDSVIERGKRKYVYLVNSDGSTVSQRDVTTGKSVDGMIQILTGVSLGEKIVIEGMRVLGEGSTIKDITKGNNLENSSSSTENIEAKGE